MRGTFKIFVGALALAIAAAVFPGSEGGAEAETEVEPKLMFGTNIGATANQTIPQAVLETEGELGRELAAVRVYENLDTNFPTSSHLWLRNTGHTMYLSMKPIRRDGTPVYWRNVAAAQPGDAIYADLQRWGRSLRDFEDTVYFIFNHEPETEHNLHLGDSEDFKAAWRKVHDVFESVGATNVRYTWVLTSWAFRTVKSDRRYAKRWYPGNPYVDEIGADPYNWFDCRPGDEDYPWRGPEFSMGPVTAFGKKHPHKELMLAEYGSVEDSKQSGRKADWISQMETLFRQPGWEQWHTVLYYHSIGTNTPSCNWRYDTSSSAQKALAELGADPYFQLGVE